MIEEPTAAAVAYRLHKRTNIHHILVYDFGGGTLDVSLLYVSKGSVQVYATDGDDSLGGSDLDLCLFDVLRRHVEEKSQGQSGRSTQVVSMAEYLHSLEESESKQTNKESTTTGGMSSLTMESKVQKVLEKSLKNALKIEDFCLTTNLRNHAETVKKSFSSAPSYNYTCYLPPDYDTLFVSSVSICLYYVHVHNMSVLCKRSLPLLLSLPLLFIIIAHSSLFIQC